MRSTIIKLTYGLVLLTLSACQCSTAPRDANNEIKALINRVANAAEARSIKGVSEHLLDSFSGEGAHFGGNKNSLKRGLQIFFIRRSEVFVLPHLRRIELNDQQTEATIRLWVVVSQSRVDFESLTMDLRGQVLDVEANLTYVDEWRVQTANWKKIPIARLLAEKLVD